MTKNPFGIGRKWIGALLLSYLASSVPLKAEVRTFTSPDGRTLQAEIVSATSDAVSLKLGSGQVITAPLSKFSPQDQAYVGNWLKTAPKNQPSGVPDIRYDFAISFSKEKVGTRKTKSMNQEITQEEWICKMKINNRSGQPLDNVVANYLIFYSDTSDGKPVVRRVSGQTQVGTIKHLQEVVVPTKSLNLSEYRLEGGFYFSDGTRARRKDNIEGLIVNILVQGKQVYSWSSPGVPAGAGGSASDEKGSLFR